MLFCDRVGRGMYRFAALETYRHEGDEDGCGDANEGTDLDLAFDPRLVSIQSAVVTWVAHGDHTSVAEMPG